MDERIVDLQNTFPRIHIQWHARKGFYIVGLLKPIDDLSIRAPEGKLCVSISNFDGRKYDLVDIDPGHWKLTNAGDITWITDEVLNELVSILERKE